MVLLSYLPAWNAGFVWDDNLYVTNNPLITAPDGLWRIWFTADAPSQYFPFTYTAFRFEHALWGFHPAGYHLTNIILHAANAVLAWRLLKRLAVPGAWLAAAIFALHPVQVETVAWITEQKNLLMCLFFLMTMICWIRFLDGPRKFWYLLALALYALALASKTTACTLPAALLLVLWVRRQPITWIRLAQIVPFLVMAIGMGLLTMWWERYHIGTHGTLFSLTLPERLLVASHAIWFYLGKLLWPVGLTFSYPKWSLNAGSALAYGWWLAFMGAVIAIYLLRGRLGRGIETALVFFIATLSPVLGFIMLYTFRYTYVADHYQYLACLGVIALAAAGITIALKQDRWLRTIVSGSLLAVLAVLTYRQSREYADSDTLWRATIRKNPASFIAHSNLGYFLDQQGDWDQAVEEFQKAITLEPGAWEAYYDLGNAYAERSSPDVAVVAYELAIKNNPDWAPAYLNLANTYLKMGRIGDATLAYQQAIAKDPRNSDAHDNYGLALFEQGNIAEATAHYRQAIELDPANTQAHINYGKALARTGRPAEAIAEWQAAARLDPRSVEAWNNLAWIRATCPDAAYRNGAQAVEFARRANELAGDNPITLGTLGAAQAASGNFSEALATAQRGLDLATAQDDRRVINALEAQIAGYRKGKAFIDSSLTNAAQGTTSGAGVPAGGLRR